MTLRIEEDGRGARALVEERARPAGARLFGWFAALLPLPLGLFVLWLSAAILSPAGSSPPQEGRGGAVVAGVLFALLGGAFLLAGLLGARRGVPRTEATRTMLDGHTLDLIAELPEDDPVRRLLRAQDGAGADGLGEDGP